MLKIGENQNAISNMVDCREAMPCNDGVNEHMADIVDETARSIDGGIVDTSKRAVVGFEGDAEFEPRNGIEFESHEAAYAFYQEYAKSMGFTTSIKNSRRSKKSKEFIDAKFACSRYGVTPESDVGSSRRSSVKKTDCKASMHVKRRPDGKWIIHEFIKEHNHELLPALAYHFRIYRNVKLAEKNNIDILNAVSERTRKMYVEMSRQSGGYQNVSFLQNDVKNQFDKGRHLVVDEGDAQLMLEYFKRIKKENPDFFYAIDLNEEQRLRNLFWVDAKSRNDYAKKIPKSLAHVIGPHENFLPEFNNCIFKSWTDEEFDLRWWKMIAQFELQGDEWVQSLYEDRKKWVPTFMDNVFLAGMSASQRSESMNSFFDKYIHKKITLKEFVKQYGAILQNRYEEEAIADFDTWQKQPALKSPSPWEKQMSIVYTHAIFKKFQVEVLGVVGCHPKRENENQGTIPFRVQDCEKDENFMVIWNEEKSEVSCSCRLFECRGFLCRHAMIVLQMCGRTSIPPRYILKRWTKDAKSGQSTAEGTERVQTRVQRYNDLCKQAIELSEQGSLSEESYNIAFRVLVEALKNCVNVNNSCISAVESTGNVQGLREAEEENQGSIASKSSKKKNTNRKRKGQPEPALMFVDTQDSLQQMDNLNSDGITLNGYYGAQQNVQGLVQLNLMEPPHDGYYVNQQSMQGLGQLNSIAPSHDSYFGTQQSMHGMGHLDYRPSTSFTYALQDEPQLRSTQLHGGVSRHP
ncbi:hypothetical protein V6N12_023010 [Hibiscus sabdariffa]|uniref:Protein FAR1-RELATED SEQUENCE n=1 Tax=Hibiscus sabdariffa TaxID=183260 RepID=A0ABR2FWF7_9ROSI